VTETPTPDDSRLPRFVFLTEGGSAVGLGHVARCAALARAVADGGAHVSFLIPDDPSVLALLRRRWAVVAAPWTTDPAVALDAARSRQADVVVVDSYAARPELLRALRSVAGQVVAVDDKADRELPVDVVVNGGVSAERLPYRRTPDTVYLLGPSYALLDSSFAEPPARSWGTRVQRILICLGGGRHGSTLLEVLAGLERVAGDWAVDVAAGSFSHDWPELDAAARRARRRVSLHRDRFGLRDLMLAADIAVSGGGVTLCELAATATPTVAVQTADNQAGNVDGFERAGAALAVRAGANALGDCVATALERLAGDHTLRASMGARARQLVDGQGARRVATALARLPISRR
jgi:UDP-2,4-diacetamido-2,4,6-trideoxy-beta-L-altropyranose hydrolase